MSVRRLAFMSAAAMLGFGLAGGPTLAWADSAPSQMTSTSAPTVSQDATGLWTVTLPGVGSVSFTVDSTTGAITGLTVLAADGSGFSAGSPTTTDEGVQVLFTSATTTRVLQVEVEPGENGPKVTAEADVEDPATGENDGSDDATSSAEDGNESTAQSGDTSTSAEDGVTSTSQEGSDGAGESAPAGTPTTTTTEAGGGDSGTSGTSGDGGSGGSDGGSTSGSSSHG